MISDTIEIVGRKAHFTNAGNGSVDLASGTSGLRGFASEPLRERQEWHITGIDLVFATDGIADLFRWRPEPFLRISVIKELLPGFYSDPFETRIHSISGHNGFKAGEVENGFYSDIQGVYTLISNNDGPCRWLSKKYDFPSPLSVDCVGWHLAISQLSLPETLKYSVRLFVTNADSSTNEVTLVTNVDATTPRWANGLGLTDVVSLQFEFVATSIGVSDLSQRVRSRNNEGVGVPLLQGISILEKVASPLAFHSLSELMSTGTLSPTPNLIATGLQTARFAGNLEVLLNTSKTHAPAAGLFERIELTVNTGLFDFFEARLVGDELLLHPPVRSDG